MNDTGRIGQRPGAGIGHPLPPPPVRHHTGAHLSMLGALMTALATLLALLAVAPAHARTPSATSSARIGVQDGTVVSKAGFAHPGVNIDRAQLTTMRDMVAAGKEPWASAYKALSVDPTAAKDYILKGPVGVVSWRSNGANQYRLYQDGHAAGIQTDMWYVTGDNAYRDNALKIIRAWTSTLTEMTEGIHAPVGLAEMTQAAEILRYTSGSGWTDADTASYSSMARLVMRSRDDGGIDQPGAFMNQAGAQLQALVSFAVFLDDRDVYDQYMNRITVGNNPDPLIDVAISKQITADGQVNEMGRDQGHAGLDVAQPAYIASTSYIQHTRGDLGADGVDLFSYLDNRLLKGADYFARYNLGHDVTWDSGYAYDKVSTTGRGIILASVPLYNHYKYVAGVGMDDHPYLERNEQLVLERNLNPLDILQTTPAKAVSRGPLTPVDTDVTPDSAFDRHGSADGITAISGTDDVGVEPYVDSDGARNIITNVQKNGWVEYKDFDFGDTPRSTLVVRAGVSSSVGSSIAVKLDSPTGETIGTVKVPSTGGAVSWATIVTKLTRAISGTHIVVLQWSGSNNTYSWQGGLNWFKAAAGSAQTTNSVADAPEQSGTTEGPGGKGLTFTDGASVGYSDLDFDNGAASVSLNINTTSAGTLEIHRGSAAGGLIRRIALPSTGGKWADISALGTADKLLGRQDVTLVYKGSQPAAINTFRFTYVNPVHPVTTAGSYLSVVSGGAKPDAEADETGALSLKAGTTLGFAAADLSGDYLAVRYSSPEGAATVKVHTRDLATDPVATARLPQTRRGEWRTHFVPLPDTVTGGFTYFTTDNRLSLASLQSDPDVAAPATVTHSDISTRYFVGQPVTVTYEASDPFGQDVHVRAVGLPEGATFRPATGTFTWTPTSEQTGDHHVTLLARVGDRTVYSDVTLHVLADATAAVDEIAAAVDPSDYTDQSAESLTEAVTEAKTAVKDKAISYPDQPASGNDTITLDRVNAYLELVQGTVDRMRKPYTVDADGAIDVLGNAVVTYDGDTSNTTNANAALAFDGKLDTTPNGVNWTPTNIDFGPGTPTVVDGARFYPRANEAKRLSKAVLQGSNDKTTWATVGTAPTITDNTQVQWYDLTMAGDATQYRYLRIAGVQYFHVAEVQIRAHFVDTAVVGYQRDSAGLLSEADYSADSWQRLQTALSSAETVSADPKSTQEDVDAAAEELRQTRGGLVAA